MTPAAFTCCDSCVNHGIKSACDWKGSTSGGWGGGGGRRERGALKGAFKPPDSFSGLTFSGVFLAAVFSALALGSGLGLGFGALGAWGSPSLALGFLTRFGFGFCDVPGGSVPWLACGSPSGWLLSSWFLGGNLALLFISTALFCPMGHRAPDTRIPVTLHKGREFPLFICVPDTVHFEGCCGNCLVILPSPNPMPNSTALFLLLGD